MHGSLFLSSSFFSLLLQTDNISLRISWLRHTHNSFVCCCHCYCDCCCRCCRSLSSSSLSSDVLVYWIGVGIGLLLSNTIYIFTHARLLACYMRCNAMQCIHNSSVDPFLVPITNSPYAVSVCIKLTISFNGKRQQISIKSNDQTRENSEVHDEPMSEWDANPLVCILCCFVLAWIPKKNTYLIGGIYWINNNNNKRRYAQNKFARRAFTNMDEWGRESA